MLCLQVQKSSLHTVTDKFRASLHRCFVPGFVQVGLWPQQGKFVQFSYGKKGYLTNLIPQVEGKEDSVSLAEIASEVALTSRPDNAEESDADSDAKSEEDSDADGESDDEAGPS